MPLIQREHREQLIQQERRGLQKQLVLMGLQEQREQQEPRTKRERRQQGLRGLRGPQTRLVLQEQALGLPRQLKFQ